MKKPSITAACMLILCLCSVRRAMADAIYQWNLDLGPGHRIGEFNERLTVQFDTNGLFGPVIGTPTASCIDGGPMGCSVTGFFYSQFSENISFSGGYLDPAGRWITTDNGLFSGRYEPAGIIGPGVYDLRDISYLFGAGRATITVLSTPEPSSLLLFAVGLAALVLIESGRILSQSGRRFVPPRSSTSFPKSP